MAGRHFQSVSKLVAGANQEQGVVASRLKGLDERGDGQRGSGTQAFQI